jgi:hypothetical protein
MQGYPQQQASYFPQYQAAVPVMQTSSIRPSATVPAWVCYNTDNTCTTRATWDDDDADAASFPSNRRPAGHACFSAEPLVSITARSQDRSKCLH